ncbi:MAG: GGDEF domain-containing protein [Rhodospirillum sp.]|nr:GGDEF domain-containing protein [Rhodospirillum sp.]MCF8489055.1 GGDEF domain-containing protein [Rhodospirillum sp.]MCF8499756.1 GGDEF domain-containing protein [Rhodospirillum sp.]
MAWLSLIALMVLVPLSSALATQQTRDGAETLIPVRVQLKWYHAFQFAGFYAAQAKGYFADAGLAVELLEGDPSIDPATVVAEGNADFGIGTSSLVINYAKGLPLVAIASFFQHSPFVILARRDTGIKSVADLEGRTVMLEPHSDEILAYLITAGVDLDKITFVPHSGRIGDLAMDAPRRVDAMTSYLSTEPFLATRVDIPFETFDPKNLGIDFYGDTLFTTRALADQDPARVKAMRDALIKGWQYALAHSDEIVSLIRETRSPHMDRVALGVEAQIIPALFNADIVDIGYMSAKRWRLIADTFTLVGMITEPVSLEAFLFQDSDPLPHWVEQILVTGLVALVLSLGFILHIIQINGKLKRSFEALGLRQHQLEMANGELARLSTTDALTGLANRRHFDEHLAGKYTRSRQLGLPLTLIIIDVDFFKSYNDLYGHQAGDSRLRDIAGVLARMSGREGDLAARYGGEEFALVRPDFGEDDALRHAQAVLAAIHALALPHEASPFGVLTATAGVKTLQPEDALSVNDLIARADAALYRAKRTGRHRVEIDGERNQ